MNDSVHDPEIGIKPVPKPDPDYIGFVDDQHARARRAQPDLLFLGDSITWNWMLDGPEPWQRLRPVWDFWYGERRAVALGCGGEQTQHLLWRLERGQLDGLAPRVTVLLVGTNNIAAGQQNVAQAAMGVTAAVRAVQRRLPDTHLVVLGILPRGPARLLLRAQEVNAQVQAGLAGLPRLTWLDIGPALMRGGKADPSLFLEYFMPGQPQPVHPNAAGAEAMACALEPTLSGLLDDRNRLLVPALAAALRPLDLARVIDHTLLKPDATRGAVATLCEDVVRHGFRAACVNPVHVPQVAAALRGTASSVCSVVGFPFGATPSAGKAYETAQAVADGAQEIDMVIDVGALKDGRADAVRLDVAAVRAACGVAVLKVIIETCLLDDAEKRLACRLAAEAGADFVKTSTGFGAAGATAADVALMRAAVGPRLGVKASGGVRDLAAVRTLLDAGATRIGASGGVALLAACASAGHG